ncbi:MAG: response regulator [Rhodoferax sp.]|nr:response regulator [Rhodoferax sp.]
MIDEADILDAHILIVDDQQSNVSLLQRMLAETGYTHISSSTTPTQVCAMHRMNQYDLILLDLQMPGMDGFAVMEALKTNLDDAFLPVIVITAQPGHKLRALQAGARDFISKPFDVTELRTRIRNTLEVCLLYKSLARTNAELEARVQERTAELRESEARYRSLTELASDWYWEQDEQGSFTKVTGPVLDMLGIQVDSLTDAREPGDEPVGGWDVAQHAQLMARIAAREPFLDFELSRTHENGQHQRYRISGEPVFNRWNKFIGYRGVGVEMRS